MARYLFFILGCFLLSNCNQYATGESELFIHIQSGFDDDQLTISIDDQEIITSRFTTNNSIAFAGQASPNNLNDILKLDHGKHHISVLMNKKVEFNKHFALMDVLYIGINYDIRKKKIYMVESNDAFQYD